MITRITAYGPEAGRVSPGCWLTCSTGRKAPPLRHVR